MKWGLRTRIIYWLTKRRRGRIHIATRVRAYNPKLLELAFRMDIHTAARGTVPRHSETIRTNQSCCDGWVALFESISILPGADDSALQRINCES